MENMDPFMDLLPNNLQGDLFNTLASNDGLSQSMPYIDPAANGWENG